MEDWVIIETLDPWVPINKATHNVKSKISAGRWRMTVYFKMMSLQYPDKTQQFLL